MVESGHEHGLKAARYALEIFRGVPMSSLPVIQANVGQKMINRAVAMKLGIALPDVLPKDVLVVAGE
jgi:ABC-type uncharacterized transport system substrate-binding protein